MNDVRVKMQTMPIEARKKSFRPFLLGYTKEQAIKEAKRCLDCRMPRCQAACPINNDIPRFIEKIIEDDLEAAYKIIRLKSNQSEICGTICPHEDQCEGACVRGIKGESVAIGSLERYISKWARENNLDTPKKASGNNKKIACIGSGPASLACAEELAISGHNVTIIEKENFIGGVLTWGIPSYRLESEVVKHKIEVLKSLGVEFETSTKVDDLNKLRDDYDAIFLGIGAPISNTMNIPGEDLKGVYPADTFLSNINLLLLDGEGRRVWDGCGKKVVVVGGGNVAMDAARNAIRQPQTEEVTIVYRRTENEMPACKEELEAAKEEGITFATLQNPVEFIGKDGKLKEVVCAVMELGEPDSSGRKRPIETDKKLRIEADTVVLALGFSNDKTIGENTDDLRKDEWGHFLVDEEGRTSAKGIYAGGDATTGAATVVKAMAAGMKAAKAIIEDFK